MNFQELMARMAELDQPVRESEKAEKDYDSDGEIESPKDEVWGSRAKAAAKSGTPFKEENVEKTFEQGIEEIADEMDECGGMMGSMSTPSKQQDNVSMNVSMNGSGSGGIRDLMNILRNLEQGHDHSDDDSDKDGGLLIKNPMSLGAEPVLGDDYANSPNAQVATDNQFPVDHGNDLHKPKSSYSDKPYRGDNPMAVEGIKNRLHTMYEQMKNQ